MAGKYLKGKSGQKRRAAPAKPFKDSFALEIPNPDYEWVMLGIDHDVGLKDLYSDEYKSRLPITDHTPRSYEDILEAEKKKTATSQ